MLEWLYDFWSDLCQWLAGANEHNFDLKVEDLDSHPDAQILSDEEIERLSQSVPNLAIIDPDWNSSDDEEHLPDIKEGSKHHPLAQSTEF